MEIFDAIVHSNIRLDLPKAFSPQVKELVLALLDREPRRRIGKRSRGKKGMLDLVPRYKSEDLLARRIPAPYVPEVKDASDVTNFKEVTPEEMKTCGAFVGMEWTGYALGDAADPFGEW